MEPALQASQLEGGPYLDIRGQGPCRKHEGECSVDPEAILEEGIGRRGIGESDKGQVPRRHGRSCGQGHGAVWAGLPCALGLWPLSGSLLVSFIFQGFCTKMCLLCSSYSPCTGKNRSPGEDQVPGPAGARPRLRQPSSWAPVGGMSKCFCRVPRG